MFEIEVKELTNEIFSFDFVFGANKSSISGVYYIKKEDKFQIHINKTSIIYNFCKISDDDDEETKMQKLFSTIIKFSDTKKNKGVNISSIKDAINRAIKKCDEIIKEKEI